MHLPPFVGRTAYIRRQTGLPLDGRKVPHGVPPQVLGLHAIVHVAFGPGDYLLVVDADLHTVEHEAGSLHHAVPHGPDGVGSFGVAGLDQEGIVERGVDGDAGPVPEDGGQAHHLSGISLHRGVHQRRGRSVVFVKTQALAVVDAPPKRQVDVTKQGGLVDRPA